MSAAFGTLRYGQLVEALLYHCKGFITEGRIVRGGSLDLGGNPVVSVITATPGTGVGWPSFARQTLATPPSHIDLESVVPVQELNGSHPTDFDPEGVTVRHFRRDRQNEPDEAIDTLEPCHESRYESAF